MDNFEKFNLEKLSASEMKEVQGGGVLDDLNEVIKSLAPIIDPLIKAIGG